VRRAAERREGWYPRREEHRKGRGDDREESREEEEMRRRRSSLMTLPPHGWQWYDLVGDILSALVHEQWSDKESIQFDIAALPLVDHHGEWRETETERTRNGSWDEERWGVWNSF
jgi:hypothetical protein